MVVEQKRQFCARMAFNSNVLRTSDVFCEELMWKQPPQQFKVPRIYHPNRHVYCVELRVKETPCPTS